MGSSGRIHADSGSNGRQVEVSKRWDYTHKRGEYRGELVCTDSLHRLVRTVYLKHKH